MNSFLFPFRAPVVRVSDKVLIPQEQHPDINFVGLLIGPRGNTLKAMEKETGAKIIIRGKGSVKEGKVGRKDGQPLPGEDEPLHAFITAANPECVKKAVEKINEVIKQGIDVPEGHNDLRRMQLRELAQLNGTLRETDGPRCTNCGSTEHKSWLCPDKPNVTNNIMCSSCGGAGHIAKDCKGKRPGQGGPPTANSQAKIDEEYLSLMAELGEGPPPKAKDDHMGQSQMHHHRGTNSLFERPSAPRAINCAPNPPPQWNTNMPPPPQPPPQPPPFGIPALMQPPPGIPPPPMMPWMPPSQPLPPGSSNDSMPLPPGTGPSPLMPPPPPGTGNSIPVSRYSKLYSAYYIKMKVGNVTLIIIYRTFRMIPNHAKGTIRFDLCNISNRYHNNRETAKSPKNCPFIQTNNLFFTISFQPWGAPPPQYWANGSNFVPPPPPPGLLAPPPPPPAPL